LELGFARYFELVSLCLLMIEEIHCTNKEDSHRVKIYSINKTRPLTAHRLKVLKEKGVPIVPITHPMEFDLQSDEDYQEEMRKQGGREPEE
jgi:sulfite oxidase